MAAPSDDLMKMMSGAGGQPGAQALPSAPQDGLPTQPPPMGAPMSTPEPAKGKQAGAQINVQMAQDLLQQSLPAFPPNSPESQSIMETLERLTKIFGSRESETRKLIPAEIMALNQALPQAGGASPEQKTMQAAPIPGMQGTPQPM